MRPDALDTLLVPWSEEMSPEEKAYKDNGLFKTAGTVFMTPPSKEELLASFSVSHKNTNLSVGARALSKHFVRTNDADHPFWVKPCGPETTKSETALRQFEELLSSPGLWRNIHGMHSGVVVYEMRNSQGYGMRWQLLPELKFRGYLEPLPAWHTETQDPAQDPSTEVQLESPAQCTT